MTILTEISAGIPLSILPHLTAANKILLSVGRQTPGIDSFWRKRCERF